MPARQKLLIAALVVIAAAYLFDAVYRSWYEEPMTNANRAIESLEEKRHESNLQVRRQQKRLPNLDTLQPRSLPGRLEVAVTDYRSWLLEQINAAGLQPPNLDTSTPSNVRNLYNRLTFTVRSRGTLTHLTNFLHRFYTTDYLHKLRSVSLTPTADGQLDISLTIETLSVPMVANSDRLPTPTENTDVVGPRPNYDIIARRNVFRQGEPIAAGIRVSAITLDRNQQRKAWLRNEYDGTTRIVSPGETFVVDGTQVQIQEVAAERVEILVDGVERTVPLGKTLE